MLGARLLAIGPGHAELTVPIGENARQHNGIAALGLAVKQAAYPSRALVVGLANGMISYVPTPDAFNRGGYETTLSTVSKLAPEAGEQLVRAAASLIPDRRSSP
jgi:hypothetical protein